MFHGSRSPIMCVTDSQKGGPQKKNHGQQNACHIAANKRNDNHPVSKCACVRHKQQVSPLDGC